MKEDPQQPDLTPMSSPANDIRNLKANSAASAQELMVWLNRMRGKAPNEVLGEVATSQLFKSLIQSTLLLGLIIGIWTAAAWGMEKFTNPDQAETETTPPAVVEKKDPETNPSTTATPKNIANPATATMPDLTPDSKIDAAKRMGVNDTIDAPKNTNPLESAADDLLKDLE